MIKKWNAVCSWMLTLFLLGHMLTMSIPVLTGGQDYSDCQILAGGIVATVLIHVVLCIVSYYPRRGVLNFHRYRKENWRLITQRISGIVILILLYPHMRVFGDFKVRDYGYSQFKQYIQSFPKVELIEDGERTRAVYVED